MSNRFEAPKTGFLDLAITQLKKAKTFLDDVNKLVDWQPINKVLKQKKTCSKMPGCPAYPALKMFKVLLLQRWYNLSDREMDDALTDRISFRRFVGFSFDYDTPDFSTICRFRNTLVRFKLDEISFSLINKQLESYDLIVKQGIIVDASIVQSSRKPRKMVEVTQISEDENLINEPTITYSEDSDAKWTIKAKKPYYGYKLHMSTDLYHGFITDGTVTSANRADTKEMIPLVKRSFLKNKAVVLADKGYCSSRNRENIVKLGYIPGIMYRAYRNRPLTMLEKGLNSIVSSIRGTVERVFGTLKRGYGFYRTRYLGIAKTRGQFFLSAMAYNLKKATTFMV